MLGKIINDLNAIHDNGDKTFTHDGHSLFSFGYYMEEELNDWKFGGTQIIHIS